MKEELNILFVCTGNTCRSVLAQGLFQKMWEQWADKKFSMRACSAGIGAFEGLAASPEALQILREEGLDLSAHRSRKLTSQLVAKANFIYTMTRNQKNYILSNYPEAKGKVLLMREACGENEDEEIPDPYGLDLENYRLVSVEIKKALKKIMERLNALAQKNQRTRAGE